MPTFAAVDLGASSGRVIAGRLRDGAFELSETARFSNGPVAVGTEAGPRLYWDVLRLWEAVAEGLGRAARDVGPLGAVGVDTWAVDYGLLDSDGALIGNPASYRCNRTVGAAERFHERLRAADHYNLVGLQVQPFNTVFQLSVDPVERLAAASRLLLIPDLLGYWLTGRDVAEVTNASTTGLLDPRTRNWRPEVLEVLDAGFGRNVTRLLPELIEPGVIVGETNAAGLELRSESGGRTPLVAVGTHDTASAIVAVPASTSDFAYISCGTWSLVGLELPDPVLTSEAAEANLTNELGVDGTVRFLKNVMGLWVFNEAVATWRREGRQVSVADLAAGASRAEPLRTVVDIDSPEFFPPGDMPSRIADAARRTGQQVPRDEYETCRCIFDSLAVAYRRSVRVLAEVAQRDISVIHMVGGGVQNALLCQLTADATGLPVIAGPVEATALGNLVVQARAVGLIDGGLAELREVVGASAELVQYRPDRRGGWDEAERRAFG